MRARKVPSPLDQRESTDIQTREPPVITQPRIELGSTTSLMVARFDREWEWLCERPQTAADLAALAARHPQIHGHRDPRQLVEAIRLARADERDHILGALVREASDAGPQAQLAGRIVLQAMLPLIIRLARQRAAQGRRFDDALGEALAALHQVVHTFPVTRTTKVAANLRMETVALLFGANKAKYSATRAVTDATPVPDPDEVAARRRGADEQTPTEEDALASVSALDRRERARRAGLLGQDAPGDLAVGGARAELLDVLLWAIEARVLPEAQARQLAEDYREGAGTKAQIAARRGVPVSRLTVAHSRAVRRLRAAVPGYLAAAA